MKKLILSLSAGLISFFSAMAANVDAVTISSFPSSLEQGESFNLSVDYTVVTGTSYLEASVYLYKNNAVDWNSGSVAWYKSGDIAVGSGTESLPMTIAGSTTPTASLNTGEKYIVLVFLKESNGDTELAQELDGANEVTITTSSTVQTLCDFSVTPVSTAEAGSTVTIDYEYTIASAGQMKIEIAQYDGEWTNESTIVEESIDPLAAAQTTTTGQVTLTIPSATTASADLASGKNYKIVISIFEDSWSWAADKKSDLTITKTSTSIDGITSFSAVVTPNPASNSVNLPEGAVSISNLIGETVLSVSGGETDISSLSSGIYIVTLADGSQVTFVKE